MTRTKLLLLVLCGCVSPPLRLLASEPPLAPDATASRVIVLKKERKLMLMRGEDVLKTYHVSLGEAPVGAKMQQGDHKTPEGRYVLDRRNPKSQFYKSIHISYPNAEDIAHAKKAGVSTGGDIFVHGLPNGYGWIGDGQRLRDWTDGCIAVTNSEMDEIWRAVPDGTPIEIKP